MRWPWIKPKPAPQIPPYRAPVTRTHSQEREDERIEVVEIDTSAMTQTGVHKAWRRLTGQGKL